jgi:hypothetical protein
MSIEQRYFSRMVSAILSQYLDQKNKENLASWLSRKFLIERGLIPVPPDPRTIELKLRYKVANYRHAFRQVSSTVFKP